MSLFPLESGAPKTTPSAKTEESRIHLDSNVKRWFARNLGLWRSRRHYLFSGEESLRVDMFIRVEVFAEPAFGETRFRFTWWPEQEFDFFVRKPSYEREGVMEAALWGHQLQRSRGFLSPSPVKTMIRQVDEHETIFESHYQQWDILEHNRLIDQDRYRYRGIYSWQNGDLEIVEHHHETRVEAAAPPIEE